LKTVVFTLVFFIGSGMLIAAQNSNSGTASVNSQKSKTVQTIHGCLTKSGNTYIILGGAPMRQYRVIGGDLAALRGKENHTVEITGPVGQVKSGASPNGDYGPASTTGVGYDTIVSQRVKQLYPNCGIG
jgi:hypothetical protein